MYSCPKCAAAYGKINSLRIHYAKAHMGSARELYVALFCGGTEPKCGCGCGLEVKFHGVSKGFSTYVPGHQSRVKNNWGHNEKARRKSLQARREMWANGEIVPWCKGKTKKDADVSRMIEKGRQTILNNPEERIRRSERMRQGRLDGTIPSLFGSDHPSWKGGTSHLGMMCHANRRLYTEWKFPKLQAANFQCERCGSSDQLQVHHNGERMSKIIHRFRWELFPDITEELAWEEKERVVEAVVDHHLEAGVSGEVLCRVCHDEEHDSLNF